jgi:hypothetical protein
MKNKTTWFLMVSNFYQIPFFVSFKNEVDLTLFLMDILENKTHTMALSYEEA